MKLEDIKKLCDEATPGPWVAVDGGIDFLLGGDERPVPLIRDPMLIAKNTNLQFIAMARTVLPKLLAVAEAANQITERYAHADNHNGDKIVGWADFAELERCIAALEADA